MTKVKLINNDEFILEITGHSGYANVGSDIVCSAISSMSTLLIEYLNKVYGNIVFEVNEKYGYLYFKTRKIIDNHSEMLIMSYKEMIADLCEQYPSNVMFIE